MPITQSAKKALRQSHRRRAQNIRRKESAGDAIKAVKKMAAGGNAAGASDALARLYAALDKAAKTHALNKNKAARLKSRLTRLIAKSSRTQ
jgi:small subunit ribosomal protein S20